MPPAEGKKPAARKPAQKKGECPQLKRLAEQNDKIILLLTHLVNGLTSTRA